MNSCATCGDRWPDDQVHTCWVQAKLNTQDVLPNPPMTDYMRSRPVLTDAEWEASRG